MDIVKVGLYVHIVVETLTMNILCMDVVVSLSITHTVKPRCIYIRLGTDGRLKGASRGGGILKFGRSFSPNFSTFRATKRYSQTKLAFLARALNFYLRRTSLT